MVWTDGTKVTINQYTTKLKPTFKMASKDKTEKYGVKLTTLFTGVITANRLCKGLPSG